MNAHVSRIALWQTAFLGDAVLTLPLAAALKRARPEAEIVYFTRKGFAPLFAAQPEFAAVREFDKRGAGRGLSGALSFGRALAREGFDLMVSAHASFRSALVAAASQVPVRVGYDAPFYNRLAYTETVARRFAEREEIERLLALLDPLSIEAADPWPRIALPEAAQEAAADFWRERVRAPVLGIHPGSVWPTKRWPGTHFSRVAEQADAAGMQVMLFAGPGEERMAAEVKAEASCARRIIDLSGRLSLPELAAWIKRLDCYLTNDSGPMHLAWPQMTPTVALFGPTVRALGFFPRGEHAAVLETDLACRPCGLHGGKSCRLGHHECLRAISPERVFAAVEKHMEKRA